MSRLQSPKLKVLVHACVRMYSDEPKRVVYVDPFKVAIAAHDADVIFVTHPHGDHFSEKDIRSSRNQIPFSSAWRIAVPRLRQRVSQASVS